VKRAKPALLPVLASLIVLGVSACGSSSKSTTTASTAASSTQTAKKQDPAQIPPEPVEAKVDADHDSDIHAPYDDKSNASELEFGKPASAADTRAITAAIKRYYAVALAGNGAKACTLIYSPIAESVVEDYGQSPPGQPYMTANSCAGAMTLMFKHFHPQFVAEVPHLRVKRVQLEEHHGIAILSFGKLAERNISIIRERHAWKIAGLLDKERQ
jgi:hypothetical protein